MPRRQSEEKDDASPQHCSTALTKAIRNDWAGYGGQDAKETDSESDANVEKEFDEQTGMLA
jgi:hypothetical protein